MATTSQNFIACEFCRAPINVDLGRGVCLSCRQIQKPDDEVGIIYEDEHESREFDLFTRHEFGCIFPGDCLMPGSHFTSECHTVEMMEAWEAEVSAHSSHSTGEFRQDVP